MFRFKLRCKLVHFILSKVLHIQPVICSDTALTPIYCKSTPKRSHKTSNIFSSARLVEALPVHLLSLSLSRSLSFPDFSFNSHSSSYHRGAGRSKWALSTERMSACHGVPFPAKPPLHSPFSARGLAVFQ